jgi:hypothetical protein
MAPMERALRIGLAALAGTVGCLAASPQPGRMPENRTALAVPEPDPACQGSVRQALASNGLDRVVVSLARTGDGGAEVVRFLRPDLTPAAADDLRRAMGTCAWNAPAPGDAAPSAWEVTFLGAGLER